MISEYDLDCTTCGGSLTRREVAADSLGFDSLGFDAHGAVEIAECPNCGGRYFPETTLENLRT